MLAFLALGSFHSLATPLLEGPDEPSHLRYAQYLARTGRVPPLDDPSLAIYERIQPPAVYALLAPWLRATGAAGVVVFEPGDPEFVRLGGSRPTRYLHGPDERWPFRGDVATLHALRLAGVAFGALAVALACAIGAEVFPGRRAPALAAGWTVALLPQLAHVAGCFNNDGAAAFAGALALLASLRFLRSPSSGSAFRVGLAVGLATLVKLTGVVLAPLALAAALVTRGVTWRARVRHAAALVGGCVLAAGWYFLGNGLLYGNPLENLELHRAVDPPQGGLPAAAWAGIVLPVLFASSFADFGWMSVVAPRGALFLFAALLAAALVGWARPGRANPALRFLGAVAVASLAAELAFNAEILQPQGRHLFFALPAFAALLVGGWSRLARGSPAGAARIAVGALGAGHAIALVGGLLPAFHPLNAGDDPHRAITNAAERLPPGEAIEVDGPPDGATTVDPPVVRWSARPGASYEVQLSVGDADFARPNWRLDRPTLRTYGDRGERCAGSYEFPADAWGALAAGTAVYWRVVRLVPAREAAPGKGRFSSSETRRVSRAIR